MSAMSVPFRRLSFHHPQLTCRDAARAIDFYKEALGARKLCAWPAGCRVMHAELQIGDSRS